MIGSENIEWSYIWQLISWKSPFALLISLIFGAVSGSFANVIIQRLPRGESILKPASHCPHCQHPIPLWHNIPIFSYLILRGKAACCGEPISPRYLIIELLCALVLGTFYLNDGWSLIFLFHSFWMLLLIVLAGIDFEHYRLPNILIISGAAVSVLWMLAAPERSWAAAGLGLLVGLGFWGVSMAVGKVMSGKMIGMGDLKLSAALGFTFGAGQFVILYIAASLTALIYAGYKMKGKYSSTDPQDRRIPMGPFFAIGAWITILIGDAVVRWYWGLISF